MDLQSGDNHRRPCLLRDLVFQAGDSGVSQAKIGYCDNFCLDCNLNPMAARTLNYPNSIKSEAIQLAASRVYEGLLLNRESRSIMLPLFEKPALSSCQNGDRHVSSRMFA